MTDDTIDIRWIRDGTPVGLRFDTGEIYRGTIDGDPIITRSGPRFRIKDMDDAYVKMFGRHVHPLADPKSLSFWVENRESRTEEKEDE
jgi:hypothetical protein